MKLSFAFASVAVACSLMACAVTEGDASSTSDEIVAGGDACQLATPNNAMCPAVYDPVCGCDGQTYGNACEASRVVKSSTPGACPATDAGACKLAKPQNTACAEIYSPVCGCDGVTYGNACEAARAVTSATPGECPPDAGACELATPRADLACIALYDPVCGCDGKTYGNACEAGRFVTSSTPGECPPADAGACKLATPKNTFCPAVYDPVCGCDGKTYGNSCEAARAVTSSTPGACSK